jgi:hypothetical protein
MIGGYLKFESSVGSACLSLLTGVPDLTLRIMSTFTPLAKGLEDL